MNNSCEDKHFFMNLKNLNKETSFRGYLFVCRGIKVPKSLCREGLFGGYQAYDILYLKA